MTRLLSSISLSYRCEIRVIRGRNRFSRLFYTDGSLMSSTYFSSSEEGKREGVIYRRAGLPDQRCKEGGQRTDKKEDKMGGGKDSSSCCNQPTLSALMWRRQQRRALQGDSVAGPGHWRTRRHAQVCRLSPLDQPGRQVPAFSAF